MKRGGIFIERQLFQSEAFLQLTKNAMIMLLALLDARKRESRQAAKDRKGGNRQRLYVNIDKIEMPYKTLEKKYGMNQEGVARAVDRLLAHGFIEISHHGGMFKHDKTQYSLVDDYLTWRPGSVIRIRKRDIKRGYQGKRIGASRKKVAQVS